MSCAKCPVIHTMNEERLGFNIDTMMTKTNLLNIESLILLPSHKQYMQITVSFYHVLCKSSRKG